MSRDEAVCDPADTALVLLEPVAGAMAKDIAAATHDLLQAARRGGLLILFLSPQAARGAADFAEGFICRSAANEAPVVSLGASAFGGSDLGLLLRANGIRTLVLAGSNRGFAMSCLARDAAVRGNAVFAAEGCVAGPVEGLDLRDGAALAANWRLVPPGRRNWHPEVKFSRLRRTLEERVDPARAALILIDVQNDFCAPDGVIGRLGEPMPLVQNAVPRIRALLTAARRAGVTIVHVRAEYGPIVRHTGSPYRFPSNATREGAAWSASAAEIREDAQFSPDSVEVCLAGSWGGEFLEGYAPLPGELVITKHRYSAFVDTPLEPMLRARGIETVIVAGVTTNCCVESTSRDAAMLDFYLVVAEDCVGVKELVHDLHDASLEQLRTYFGLVVPSSRILAAWTGRTSEAL